MTIERIEMSLLRLPYVHFFETSFGRAYDRTFIILKAFEGGVCGYGECVAEEAPLYSGETTETGWHVLRDFLVPLVFRKGIVEPEDFAREAGVFRGNRMAKAGLELALWDLKAMKAGLPLSRLYGGVRVEIEAGVSCGIENSLPELVARVGSYLEQGYRRIKIKIKPGWDVEACEAIRKAHPDIMLQADANGAYRPGDTATLKALDAFQMLMVEQPFAPYDLWEHAKLQREMTTPLCLDESILSLETAQAALEMGSCRIVNIKVGRVGGFSEAIRVHDICRANEIPVWCGGMLESGVGRSHNIALSTLENFRLPGDVSASKRYWKEDIIEPDVEVKATGMISISDAAGTGYRVREDLIEKLTVQRETLRAE